jgi:hypothetical protein
MSRLSPEQIHSLYRGIYEAHTDDFRIKLHGLTDSLGVVRNTAARYVENGRKKRIVFPPQLRLEMFAEVKEYVYALKVSDAFRTFEKLKTDRRICYEVMGKGIFDLFFMASVPFDLNEIPVREVILEGTRSSYIVPFIPDIDSRVSLTWMQEKIGQNPPTSTWEVTCPPRDVIWTNREWDIFQLLRYNASAKYSEIATRIPMHTVTFARSLERITANTLCYVPYYPKGEESYVKWILMFRSKYEHLLIDVLSCFPCTTVMYKVADWLVAHVKVEVDLSEDYLCFFYEMENQGYVDVFDMACPAVYWHPTL